MHHHEIYNHSPPNSPMFYYHIAEATYREDPKNYLDKAFGGRRVEKIESDRDFGFMNQWKIRFFRDLLSGELIVGFRGKDNPSNPDKIFKEMGQRIDKWRRNAEKKGYGSNISTFVGDSGGGYFASHVKESWRVNRITFNTEKCNNPYDLKIKGRPFNLMIKKMDFAPKFVPECEGNHITVELPENPASVQYTRDNSHTLQWFGWAFAKNGEITSDSWFKHPRPVAERCWCEIAPSRFEGPMKPYNPDSMFSHRSEKIADSIEQENSGEGQIVETQVSTPPSDTQPSVGGSGKELKELGERCQERIIQTMQLTALNLAKNIFKNARKNPVLEDLKNREFDIAIDKLKIEGEVRKARKVFCEKYISIMSNVLKQGGCIVVSSGYINPLQARYALEFFVSLTDSEANTRRERLSESVSSAAMNMIEPVFYAAMNMTAPVVGRFVDMQKGERYVRYITNIVLDQNLEEVIENVVKDPVKKIADKAISFIPENNFLDRHVVQEPMKRATWIDGGSFMYEPGVFTQNYDDKECSLIRMVRHGLELTLQSTAILGDMAVSVAALPVYLAGEKKMARDFQESYISWVNKNLLGTFMPFPGRFENVYGE